MYSRRGLQARAYKEDTVKEDTMAPNRDDDRVAGITPKTPTTQERWNQYSDMQGRNDPVIEDEIIAKEPALRQLDDIHILEKASAPQVGLQKSIESDQALGNNPDMAAFMGEDGFELDTFTAPVEESSAKGDAHDGHEQGYKFRNPFVKSS